MQVSHIDELLPQLVDYEEQMLHGQMAPHDVISLVTACNVIIIVSTKQQNYSTYTNMSTNTLVIIEEYKQN